MIPHPPTSSSALARDRALLVLSILALLVGPLFGPLLAQEPSDPPPAPPHRPAYGAPPPADPGARHGVRPDIRPDGTAPTDDPRSAVLLSRVCESDLDREELTLFANGTVRLFQGPPGEEEMALGELAPDELRTYADRIREENLDETDTRSRGPEGSWVSDCRLELHYDAMERWIGPPPVGDGGERAPRPVGDAVYSYRRFDTFSLALSRVVGWVDGIALRVDRAVGRGRLPDGYRPRRGDVLRRADGVLFRVERPTASKGGWELQGVDQPLTLYLLEDDVPKLFVELVDASPAR